MHRVLLIRVGKDLEACFDYLSACALERNSAPDLGVGFVHASAEALGNLSQPLTVLKDKLFGDLTDALTTLLKQVPGRREGFLLDILIVTQHGEPMATKAAEVVIEAVYEIVQERFGAVFPGGAQRVGVGWRMQEIGILPGHADAKRPRPEMLTALRDHTEWLNMRRADDWPIHRTLLLDAATSGGISPIEDLLDQVENIVHLLLFSGIRRSPLGIQLFETASRDVVATSCVARLETPAGWTQSSICKKLQDSMGGHLMSKRSISVATPDELVDHEIYEKPEKRFVFSTDLRDYIVQTLTTHGTAAIVPLLDMLSLTANHIRRLGEIAEASEQTEVETPTPARSRVTTVSALSTVVGGGAFGVAYLALGLATLMSAGIALITAFVGAAALLMVLPKPSTDESSQRSTRKEGEPLPQEITATLLSQVTHLEGDLKRTQASFESVASSIEHAEPVTHPTRPFVTPLASEELAATIFESLGAASDGESAVRRWVESLGTWSDILAGTALPQSADLHRFVANEVKSIDLSGVLDSTGVRARARPMIQEWLSTWSVGMSENLEINHLKSRDSDGFRNVFDNHVLAPASYEGIILDAIQGSSLRVGPTTTRDFYILTAITDIAPEAVLVLSETP